MQWMPRQDYPQEAVPIIETDQDGSCCVPEMWLGIEQVQLQHEGSLSYWKQWTGLSQQVQHLVIRVAHAFSNSDKQRFQNWMGKLPEM